MTRPLKHAYAHSDCEHPRPLLDALEHGFCSVEADVWLCDGQIRIAHDLCDAKPNRTLRRLYLEPLCRMAEGGSIFDEPAEFVLLIDIKNEPEAMYQALKDELTPFTDILSSYSHGVGVTQRAVTILLSGERPIETVSREPSRLVFLDGRLPDLRRPIDPALMPWVSDNWEKHFRWRGDGPLAGAEWARLRSLAETAHATGVKLRLWSVPDDPLGWQTMLDAGVDLLSTDRLSALQDFL